MFQSPVPSTLGAGDRKNKESQTEISARRADISDAKVVMVQYVGANSAHGCARADAMPTVTTKRGNLDVDLRGL